MPSPALTTRDDAEVEPRPAVLHKQRRHPLVVQADADLVAGHPGLADFEDRAADSKPVAYADLVVRHSRDREVFAELPHDELFAAEKVLPVAVRLDLVDEKCPLLAAVAHTVGLLIAFGAQTADFHRSGDGPFPDRRRHFLAAPIDVARPPDVHRNHRCHEAGQPLRSPWTGRTHEIVRPE